MMKKRFFAALLALALVLGLASPAGLVTVAEASVTASDAQAYLDILNRTNPSYSYLLDFDGDGRDELLTVTCLYEDWQRVFSVYQGGNALVSDFHMGVAVAPRCNVETKDGKTYISDGNSNEFESYDDYYTVRNGQWVKEITLRNGVNDYEGGGAYYGIDDREVSEAEYNQVATFQYQFSILEGRTSADVRPRLEAVVQTARYESMTPDEILAEIPYYGDRSICRLTSEQAEKMVQFIDNWISPDENYSPRESFNALLVDADGSGIPVIVLQPRIGDYQGLYTWQSGSLVETFMQMTGFSDEFFLSGNSAGTEYRFVYGWGNPGHYGNTIYIIKNGTLSEKTAVSYEWLNFDWNNGGTTDGEELRVLVTINGGVGVEMPDSQVEDYVNNGQEIFSYVGNFVDEGISLNSLSSLLRAYADAKKFPTYTYPQADSGDSHYADVTAAVAGLGNIQAVYKLTDDAYYVLLENNGVYTGAVVRGVRENSRPVWKVAQTDPEPAVEESLAELVNRLLGTANLELDFGTLRGSPELEEITAYLENLLANIDGLAPNDPAKRELAAFLDSAVASLASGALSGSDNRLAITGESVSELAAKAREAFDAWSAILQSSGVELNKMLTPVVRVLWSDLDGSTPCQLTLDSSTAQALDGFGLQILLGDSQTYVQITADDLTALTRSLGSLSIQLFQEEPGIYDIRFLDSDGQVVEQMSRSVTIGLPASGALSTIMVSYAGGSDNWGGQYDAAAGTLSFETSFSGRYEVLENDVAIDDIEGLSEESRAAISFMVSKGYFSAENGMFRPGDPLNRYEFTEALVNMFFALDRSLSATFPDVPAGSPYYAHVASAQARDIVRGLEDGTFGGEANITREQVFALAGRTLIDQRGYTQPANLDSYLNSFTDRGEISDWAEAQVALCVREGIAARSSLLQPQVNITREQSAVVLYRLFQLLYEVSPVALDVPEAAPESAPDVGAAGLLVPMVVGICIAVAALAAVAVALVLKKKKAAAPVPVQQAAVAPVQQAAQTPPPASGARFCPGCGKPVTPGTENFCPACGHSLKDDVN